MKLAEWSMAQKEVSVDAAAVLVRWLLEQVGNDDLASLVRKAEKEELTALVATARGIWVVNLPHALDLVVDAKLIPWQDVEPPCLQVEAHERNGSGMDATWSLSLTQPEFTIERRDPAPLLAFLDVCLEKLSHG